MKKKYFRLYFLFLILITVIPTTAFSAKKIGVLWGTFDPPTTVHQHIIQLATKESLDELIIVINNHNHKKYTASIEHRFEMLKLILETSKNYTLLIQEPDLLWGLSQLKQAYGDYPNVMWNIFAGQDTLDNWDPSMTDPNDTITIITRSEKPILASPNMRIIDNNPLFITVSSTCVRAAIKKEEKSWEKLVTPAVKAYIKKNGLYE